MSTEQQDRLKQEANALVHQKHEQAATAYTQALELDSTSEAAAAIFCDRSLCFLNTKKYTEAFQDATKAISLRPTWHRGYQRAAAACEKLEKYEEGLKHLKKCFALDDSSKDDAILKKMHEDFELNIIKQQAPSMVTAHELKQIALSDVNWSLMPAPLDDGKAAHLEGSTLPDVPLPATTGRVVTLSTLRGLTVLYVYPMTGRPDRDLPDGWDTIPGARGCTPQSCAFRDHYAELQKWGVQNLFGLSTQSQEYQTEAAARLHLPFALLSDSDQTFGKALDLPGMLVEGQYLHKRLTMVARGGIIAKVFYPVFPPDQNAERVIAWLRRDAEDRA